MPTAPVRASVPSRASRRAVSRTVPPPRRTAVPPPQAAAPPPAVGTLPLAYPTADASQVITVVAPSSTATTARVQAWQRSGGGWVRYGAELAGYVGTGGVTTRPSESVPAAPAGSYSLTQGFGSAANPGTALPYFRTTTADWWVSDARSRYYNTHYRCASACPFDTGAGENLGEAGYVYTYAAVIDYNRAPVVPGAGSAFFLHVTGGGPTGGCVSVPEASLRDLLRWLVPAAHPRILIGTG